MSDILNYKIKLMHKLDVKNWITDNRLDYLEIYDSKSNTQTVWHLNDLGKLGSDISTQAPKECGVGNDFIG